MSKRRTSRPADPMSRPKRGSADSTNVGASTHGKVVSDVVPRAITSRRRVLLTILVVFHLFAVVLPPLAVQTFGSGGPSPLIGSLIRPFEGYGQFLHMDRGYAFFAPDPGPSRLIQAAVVEPDGRVEETIYPNLEEHWPRLLYHRHFMLSEYLSEVYQPPGPPDDMFQTDRFNAELWQQARGRYEFIRQSMVDHLKSANGGKEVALRRLEHGLPALEDYRIEPIELTDPRLYSVLLDQPVFSDSIAPQQTGAESDRAEEIPAPETETGSQSESGVKANDSRGLESAIEGGAIEGGAIEGSAIEGGASENDEQTSEPVQ